jgi:hypothetical protein
LLHLALALEEVSAAAQLQVAAAHPYFFPELPSLTLVFGLQLEDLVLVGSESLLFLLDFSMFASHEGIEFLNSEGESAQGFLLVEFLLAQFFDFCLEGLVECEDVVVGVDGLVEFALQYLQLALPLHGFRLESAALERIEFLRLLGVVAQYFAAVLLEAEEAALVLLQHAGVVVDLPFEELPTGLREHAGVGGSAVEERTLL